MNKGYCWIGKCSKCGKTIFHGNKSYYRFFKRNLTDKITRYGSVEKGMITTLYCKCGNIIKHIEKYMPIRADNMAPPLAYIPISEKWIGVKITKRR